MTWLLNHLAVTLPATIVALGILAGVFRKYGRLLVFWYFNAQTKITQTQEQLADGYQDLTTLRTTERDTARKKCEMLNTTIAELERDLRTQVRAVQTRDDINRQDRATIRALKLRLERHRIDYSDIEETIQQQFANETNSLH